MHSIDQCSNAPVPLASSGLVLPLANASVHAGFPSPADDFDHARLSLDDLLITHPLATFFFEVSGWSMKEAGIHDRDLVVVNRALRPVHGNVVLAQVDSDFTVKYLHLKRSRVELVAANPTFPSQLLAEGQQLLVCGVVTAAIKRFV